MTTNESIRLIAEYDGWVYESEEWDGMYKISDSFWCNSDERFEYTKGSFDELVQIYLTNLNELHRVALRVTERLGAIYFDTEKEYANQPLFVDGIVNQESLRAKRIDKIERLNNNILFCFRSKPVNSQYIDLLLAVARGIEFINQSKEDTK